MNKYHIILIKLSNSKITNNKNIINFFIMEVQIK